MDTDTATHLLAALRGSGLHGPEAVTRAAAILGDPAAITDNGKLADALLKAGLVTPYMHRKVQAGRTHEIFFGPYLVLDKVGEGGMGKVYRAAQTQQGKVVALKVVRQHLVTNKTVRRRFEKEAAAAKALDHANVVKLFEADQVNGRFYLAMEYVDGIDLSRMVKEFGNPPHAGLPQYQEAVEYARQAALGLHHAHERGLVHRDVKPSNLLVFGQRALPDSSGTAEVKVLDMGLVRSLTEDEPEGMELTRDGTVVGTPDYMSPEQAKNSSTVDSRADLYSLGCTLYYLLRGRPPFPEGTPLDKLMRHQLEEPADIRQARPDIPPGLAEVVCRLMAKKPADRYQSGLEAAEALGRYCGVVPPEFEPFAFTDGPPETPAPPPPAAAQTPAATPKLRLRVAGPKSGQVMPPPAVPVAVRRPAAGPKSGTLRPPVGGQKSVRLGPPVAVPHAENAPSSESLPGVPRTPTRTTVKPPARVARPAQPRPVAPKPGKPVPAWTPLLVVGAVALVALLVLAVAGVFLLRKSEAGAAVPPPGQPVEVATAHAPAAEPPVAPLPPAVSRLPAGATGALVVEPSAYWRRVAYEGHVADRRDAHADLWQRGLGIDPRRLRRVVVAFRGRHVVVVAEGPATPPADAKHSATPAGRPLDTFANPTDGLTCGSPVAGGTALAANPATLDALLAVPPAPPADLAEALAAADVPAAAPPLLTFAATAGFVLPEGETLAAHGVRRVALTARLDGNDLLVRLTVRAKSRLALDDFVSLYLSTRILNRYPAARPFLELLASPERRDSEAGANEERTVTARIPWAAANAAVNDLLPVVK